MTTSAEAAREAARKNDGKFGEQAHSESGVTLERERPTVAGRLMEWAGRKESEMREAQRDLGNAAMAAVATELLEEFPDAVTLEVTVDHDDGDKYLLTDDVADASGKSLGQDAIDAAQDLLSQYGSRNFARDFEGAAIDLKERAAWRPIEPLESDIPKENCLGRAEMALRQQGYEGDDDPENQKFAVQDMITDLRHYADEHGIDFYEAMDRSYDAYTMDKAEPWFSQEND